MYAALAAVLDILGGYSGYPALGTALLRYRGLSMSHWNDTPGVGEAYSRSFYYSYRHRIASSKFCLSARLALRTRSAAFAVLTITLMFMAHTLAYNVRGLTGGSHGMAAPQAPFPATPSGGPF